MRIALKYIKKIVFVVIVAAFIFIAKEARNYIFSVDGYSCNFDNIISCDHKSKIFNFINLNQELKICSLESISQKIQEKFCVIKNIELSYAANGILNLNIYSNKPKFILNDKYVLSENKIIFEKSLFSKNFLNDCKPVTLNSDEITNEIEDSFRQMIFSFPEKYFQEYELIRESRAKSYLLDKTNKNFSILFNDFVVPDDRLLAYCSYIKNELQARGEFNRKVKKNWFADIRFEDQIVVVSK
jgi:hypothetical protein